MDSHPLPPNPNQEDPIVPRQEGPQEPPLPALPDQIPALDGLRGLAIFLVLVFHFTILRGSDCAFDRAWIAVARLCWCGVDLFFVLSGFLITRILLETVGRQGYLRSFYGRRALRIFPLYYGVVVLSLVVLPLVHHPKIDAIGTVEGDAPYYWLYLSNFALAAAGRFRHGILDISWSLAIEEQFYFAWPILVLLLRRRGLAVLCLVLAALALGFRAALVASQVNPVAIYVLTPSRIDTLALGSLLAILVRGRTLAPTVYTRVRGLVCVGAAVWLLLVVLAGPDQYSPWMQTLGYSVIAIVFMGLVALTLPRADGRRQVAHRLFECRALRGLGRLSYGLYLIHLPLRSALRGLLGGPDRLPIVYGSRLPGQLLFGGICFALSLGLAWLSWHILEKRFLKWKRFVPRPQGPRATTREPA